MNFINKITAVMLRAELYIVEGDYIDVKGILEKFWEENAVIIIIVALLVLLALIWLFKKFIGFTVSLVNKVLNKSERE
ncbi:MAG: hypothetical protein NC078_02830 [Ruminococcus sp.]|nr:hypothetical protein [Ruminococcus sp.]